VRSERCLGSDQMSPPEQITCEPSSIDDEFFNKALSKQLLGVRAVLRSKKRLDTADIVRDGLYNRQNRALTYQRFSALICVL